MKKKIKISGSSFLLPKSSSWQSLLDNYKLEFSNYNNWAKDLITSNKNEVLSIIVFLNDLVNIDELNNPNKKIFNKIISLLNTRLKKTFEPTIFFFTNDIEENLIKRIKTSSNLKKYLLNFFNELNKLSKKYSNFYFIDLNVDFGKHGLVNIFNKRNWYFAHCRISTKGIQIISNSINSILKKYSNPSAKVLALDCDNTLWGGVVGEDGIDKLLIGQDGVGSAYKDFQRVCKKLLNEGVILTLLSKNNENDVFEVFQKHDEMILNKKDIVAHKINWEEKSQNIEEIAKELNLGLDSFVFWDDNPIEREKMKKFCPQVNTINVPEEVIEWPEILNNLETFSKFNITKEDKKKTYQYKKRAEFVRDVNKKKDEISYLKSIKLKPKIHLLSQANIARAVQLCSKVNQYNLRSKRHSEKDLLKFSKENKNFCFLISLKDIYGDHGNIGLVCLKKINSNYVFLDTFLMSCRILGRHLESWILKNILEICKKNKFNYLIGEFIPSKKNIIVKEFLKSHKFNYLKKSNPAFDKSKKFLDAKSDKYIINTNIDKLPFEEIYEKNR